MLGILRGLWEIINRVIYFMIYDLENFGGGAGGGCRWVSCLAGLSIYSGCAR